MEDYLGTKLRGVRHERREHLTTYIKMLSTGWALKKDVIFEAY